MKSVVVDASLAIKWFIPEIHAADAGRLLKKNLKLLAPDLIFAEVGSILWKKQKLKEITSNTASEILKDFKRLPFENYQIEELIDFAWEIAIDYQCTIYDSLYVALAHSEKSILATADRALYNILSKTPLAKLLLWVEEIN